MVGGDTFDIREIAEHELAAVFDVVRQLREHLDLAEFKRRVVHQRQAGYRLYGAFDHEGRVLGVVGMRSVATLARGQHLHVDDLVVDREARGDGIGQQLIAFAERWAQEHQMESVFLDSRREVVSFYATLGYEVHTATLMRRRFQPID